VGRKKAGGQEKPIMSRKDLLIKVAKMYYIERKTQQEISESIFLSRSNVSRLLKACVDQKIVEFYINDTSSIDQELQNKLKKRFALKDAIVIPSESDRDLTKMKLGEAVAAYLRMHLKTGMTLGVSWGTTLYYVSSMFKHMADTSVDVVQLVGGMGAKSIDTDGSEITRRIAKTLNGDAYVARVPYIVQSRKLHDLLLKEPDIQAHFERAAKVDIALVGMGAAQKSLSSSRRAGYLSDTDMEKLEKEGAVADICGIQIDAQGKPCAEEFSGRIIGIGYEAIRRIPQVMGVSVGVEKTDAILSSLKSGIISVLAIDEAAAFSVLEREEG